MNANTFATLRLDLFSLISQHMHNLYIIAGCNGAGKTTASLTILPDILNCRQFVNADNIAAGLSPFDVESVAIEAGRIMLHRINELIDLREDFAIETTLATRSYVSLVQRAKALGYKVTLIYIWLSSPMMAEDRVAQRVSKGGHNIPPDIIERRYYKGIKNLFRLFMPVCDVWILADNTSGQLATIARKEEEFDYVIENYDLWNVISKQANDS
jgi:predicted ABC-type ATPase